MKQPNRFIFKTDFNQAGIKIIWKEQILTSENNMSSYLNEDDLDIVEKAIRSGIDIPVGRNNALSIELLIEKIITTLTYSI